MATNDNIKFQVSNNMMIDMGIKYSLMLYDDVTKSNGFDNIFDIYLEFISFFSILLLPVFFMSWITYFFSVVIMFFPYAVFRTQEEVRAYIYAFYNYFKLYKLLKKLK